MRVGLLVSTTLHAALLGWGLVSLGQPEEFQVADVEALPIDLVDLAELTQIQEGSEDARRDGPAAPDPVENPNPVRDAQNIGDQELDQSTPETEEQLPTEVEEARLPTPSDAPVPTPTDRPEPVDQPEAEEAPATPATEVANEPEPREDVAPDPVEEAAPAEPEPAPEPEPEFVELPEQLPTINARPERPPAQTAESPTRENREQADAANAAPRNNETDTSDDEVAALINRDRGSGGGAASSNDNASRGGDRTTSGETLTRSEEDALRQQIQSCWNVPTVLGAENMTVSVSFELDRNAQLVGPPTIVQSSGNRQVDDSARRAVLICENRGFQVPPGKHDVWHQVRLNFDLRDMFR